MNIGFVTNRLTLRGVEVAVYDYAHFNETLLGNKSIIITKDYDTLKKQNTPYISLEAYNHFKNRFQVLYYNTMEDIHQMIEEYKMDALYITKSGLRVHDPLVTSKCKCCIHAVFDSTDPHGDVMATIGNSINKVHHTNLPVVPYMVHIHDTTEDNLREELNIPDDALVFGRYGGWDSFDIDFVMDFIHHHASPNMYFIFMNTRWFSNNPYVKYVSGTTDLERKRKFINTTDAMIHARKRGETFGLACAEFCLANKPVITYSESPETNHIDILGDHAFYYKDHESLKHIIFNFKTFVKERSINNINPYEKYCPENVMNTFKQVFLSEPSKSKIFQIGFKRCGTTFIQAFCQDMKYNSVHWDGGKLASVIRDNFENNRPLLQGYDVFDAFTAMENVEHNIYAHVQYYKELDRQYPNSKFILNTGNVKTWIDKRLQMKDYVETCMKNLGVDNEETLIGIWFNQWMQHHDDVLHYFGEARIGKDLLVYNVDEQDPQTLFRFLSNKELIYKRFDEIYSNEIGRRFEYPKNSLYMEGVVLYCRCLPQRKEAIAKTFSDFGIQDYIHYFDAMTPNDISMDDLSLLSSVHMHCFSSYPCSICKKFHNGFYNKMTTCCLLIGYMICFQHSLNSSVNNYATLIFEDDIYFKCDLNHLNRVYDEFKIRNYDVLYLGFCFFENGAADTQPESEDDLIVTLPDVHYILCLHAVMYKKEYIRKVMPIVFPQTSTSDGHIMHINMSIHAKVGALRKPIVFQDRQKYGSYNGNNCDDFPLYI